MKFTVLFWQIVLIQVCLCLILVSLSIGQHGNRGRKTERPRRTMRPRRPSPTRAPGNRKGAHTHKAYTLLPWVEPPATCGRRPIVELLHPETAFMVVEPGIGGVYPAIETTTTLRPLPYFPVLNQTRKNQTRIKDKPQLRSHDVKDGFYPSFVLVKYGLEGLPCGGALVGRNVVVTAAQCVDEAHSRLVNVVVGVNSPKGTQQRTIGVEKFWFHPDSCSERKLRLMDFVILILKENVTYTDYIQPACFQPYYQHTLTWTEFNVPYVTLANGTMMNNNTYIMKQDFYFRRCYQRDPDYFWLRLTHECYSNAGASHFCNGQFGAPLYFVGRNATGYDDRHVIAGLGSFLSAPTCTANVEDGAYFFDFYRSRRLFPLKLNRTEINEKLNEKYHSQGCFRPKRRLNLYNDTANFDDLWDNLLEVPREVTHTKVPG